MTYYCAWPHDPGDDKESNTSIERKRSIGSNQHSAISGQRSTFQPKVHKTDIGEIHIHVSNSLAECLTLIADSSLIGLWLN